jgi:hypothetical protein
MMIIKNKNKFFVEAINSSKCATRQPTTRICLQFYRKSAGGGNNFMNFMKNKTSTNLLVKKNKINVGRSFTACEIVNVLIMNNFGDAAVFLVKSMERYHAYSLAHDEMGWKLWQYCTLKIDISLVKECVSVSKSFHYFDFFNYDYYNHYYYYKNHLNNIDVIVRDNQIRGLLLPELFEENPARDRLSQILGMIFIISLGVALLCYSLKMAIRPRSV